ncbi:fluoride efflux transporter CrcB [Pusillimonas sp. SM2304]|uniref:fluoride efflux transporter CrcB n=1 Tax=Pusillimonas sp. SM2304 TaxID=3073241 RepID=UPI002874F434|nr:fluoride efflux transporter CrcB [Pusillimonas sp. SM2304]MDS1142090.1 fluoride efflux transporter CrcB [Pusillimonas sp. SM2304]
MLTFNHFLAVGVGAALGAISRWLLGIWLNGPHLALPWGTLAANLAGGYLIGIVLGVVSLYPEVPLWLRLMLVTGFLGGLTTFSTFSGETVNMLMRGAYASALGYAGLSLLGSLALTALGFATVRGVHAWA